MTLNTPTLRPAMPAVVVESTGIAWPSTRGPGHQGASLQQQAKAYAAQLVMANPALRPWSADGLRGVHLAAHNARVLLHQALGDTFDVWLQGVRLAGRNHRYGSTLDVEWMDWPGEHRPESAAIKAVLEVFVRPDTGGPWSDVARAAFREAFGEASMLDIKSKKPTQSAVIKREQTILNNALAAFDSPCKQPVGPALRGRRL